MIYIIRDEAIRQRALEEILSAPLGASVDIYKKPAGRTKAQNRTIFMWMSDMLKQDVGRHLAMPSGQPMTELQLYYKIASRTVPPIEWIDGDGQVRYSPPSPSHLDKADFTMFMEAAQVFAGTFNFRLRDPALNGLVLK